MSDFVSDNELLLKSWDYKKNIISPNEAGLYSHNKYWWICDKGHSYEQVAYSKAKGTGCPYCSGKLAIKGENDLMTLHPELAKQWDYKKNTQNIETIPIGSQIKVWWICDKGHSYQRSIYYRLHGRGNCSYCSNRLVLKGFNDIATTNPELLSEWNYNKNNELRIYPTEITNGTRTKIWWICDKGHEWDSIARSRITGSGCPYCSNNKVLEGYNDIKTTNPEILALWNHEKNKDLLPSMFSHGSTKKVWWICDKGHEWESKILCIARGNRCPYCSNQKVLKGFNDLGTLYPDVVQYWDKIKNKKNPFEVASKSNESVWWICDKGHSYSMSINAKTRGNFHSCPICNKYKRVSVPEKLIYFYLKDKFDDVIENYKPNWIKPKEIDIFIPSIKLGIEYDGFRYHQDIDKDKEKDLLCVENGIQLLRIRELKCPIYNSESIKINLTQMYSQNYDYLEPGIRKLFVYLNIECDINISRDLPDVLKIINIGNKNNCIAITNPEVLDEWDYGKNETMNVTPFNVTKGTNIKAYWICDKGHSYRSSIAIKTNQHTGCPICTSKQVLIGFNDFKSQNPELIKEWDYKRNVVEPDSITKGYAKNVYWICNKGHSFCNTINNRLRGCNCPYCSGHQTLTGFNDIESQYPELMKEWDYARNIELEINPKKNKKSSSIKAYWICDKGHSYYARISGRIRGTGCPYCSGKKVLIGFNDLATKHPELIKEWDNSKNSVLPEAVSIGSHEKIWWICKNGHSYQSKVCNRVRGNGCPYCSNQKILTGFNDIATTHPEVLVNWDYSKNYEIGITPYNISKSYSKKVWWKCNNGHSYQREVYNQRNGYGKCPICKKNK